MNNSAQDSREVKVMAYLTIISAAGLYNFLKVFSLANEKSDEEMPFKFQSYVIAYIMGCIFIGLPLSILYWLVFA